MKANNQMVQRGGSEKISFSSAITSKSMQDMIAKAVPDSKAAARLTGTLLSVVNASPQLQQCEPTTIVSAALRGEGMGLILGHGYYVVPFNQTATYILGYKGLISLAMATGYYAEIDSIDVREGEMRGINRRTCKPNIDFSVYSSMEERETKKVIGYYAYFELKDGTFRYEYWSVDRLLQHANHYSKAFSLESYGKMIRGELSPAEVEKLRRGSPWYDVGGSQDNMFKKTVLRQLLNSGYAPLSNEVRSILRSDSDDPVIAAPVDVTVNDDTGEVFETTGVVVREPEEEPEAPPAAPVEAPAAPQAAAAPETPPARKTRQTRRKNAEEDERDFTNGFFGD